ATAVTTVVLTWLLWVLAFVLPAHDPGHIRFWLFVALALAIFCFVSVAALARPTRHRRRALAMTSAAAIAAGLYGIVGMLMSAARGGDFEGYVVLMGLALCFHGAAALAYVFVAPAKPLTEA